MSGKIKHNIKMIFYHIIMIAGLIIGITGIVLTFTVGATTDTFIIVAIGGITTFAGLVATAEMQADNIW